MKKEFDFDDIGKRTPYRVPEGFFEDMQQKVRQHTYGSKPAVRRFRMVIAASMAVAAVLASLLFMPSHFRQAGRGTSDLQTLDIENCTATADQWIHEMSDEELEELVSFSESDIFLN
ncbi:hypothetical protein [uncultured Bacteroides sp.]|uniref:hypothetical protein n=1 Tax=uncultured Bacteroides sp. TaxID=162156 RepID=UPI0025CCF43C|nr:hypothetical protein [uncultured Bacteroides sp.]